MIPEDTLNSLLMLFVSQRTGAFACPELDDLDLGSISCSEEMSSVRKL